MPGQTLFVRAKTALMLKGAEEEQVIETFRTGYLRKDTEEWLAENEVEYGALILLDGEPLNGLPPKEVDKKQALYKANKINELGLDIYVEDRPAVRERLRGLCPSCVILSPNEAQKVWGFEV